MATASYGLNTIVYTDSNGSSKTITIDLANSTIDFGNLDLKAKSIESTGGVSEGLSGTPIYQFADRAELVTAVNLWTGTSSEKTQAQSTYGEIGTWDVSQVTSLASVFNGKTNFNDDISNWDVSNVTVFEFCFLDASSFNQNIGSWNVSSGINFNYMFTNATSFNQNIGSWNVGAGGAAHRQANMFQGATSFNQNLTNWDLSQNSGSHDMRNMFRGATAFITAYPNGPASWGNPPTSQLSSGIVLNLH